MKKLLLCFLVPCFNLFASTVAATDFQISNSTNSCYKDECVITLNILATDTHSISNKPQILNKNVAVLSNECTSSKCSLLLRLPAKEKFVNLSLNDNGTKKELNYKYQIPEYFLAAAK